MAQAFANSIIDATEAGIVTVQTTKSKTVKECGVYGTWVHGLMQVISCDVLGMSVHEQTRKGWKRNKALVNKTSGGQADSLYQWLQHRKAQFSEERYEELRQAQDYNQVNAWLRWLNQFHKSVRKMSKEHGVPAGARFIVSGVSLFVWQMCILTTCLW